MGTGENDPRAGGSRFETWRPPADKNEKLGEGDPLEVAEQAARDRMNSHPEESTKSVKSDEGSTSKHSALEAAEQAADEAAQHDEKATANDTDGPSTAIKQDAAKLVENQEEAIAEIKKQGALIEAVTDAETEAAPLK